MGFLNNKKTPTEMAGWVWNDVPDDLIAVAEFYSGMIGYICEYED